MERFVRRTLQLSAFSDLVLSQQLTGWSENSLCGDCDDERGDVVWPLLGLLYANRNLHKSVDY